VERAVRPGFSLTEDNAEAVARVCRRLDGMPLAIELAAAKTRVLSVEQIASRLDDRFALLTGGRTTMAHHKTLRAAMEWSYDLLSEEEQFFFRGLSVFAGGFTLEAAGAVYEGTEETAILDLLISLSDKSLVLVTEQDGKARYGLLETIRQYALERLEHSGEAEVLRERHAEYYLSLAEEAEPELRGARQGEWLGRLEKDYDNIRAALSWTLERGRSESALRLCGTMGEFWHMLGRQSEGSRWSEAALAIGADAPKPVRAKALFVSPRTVNWHLGSVYRKLGFSSRVEAARFAAEHGLLS
jgi:non-specific serine/threonine protein kinase